MFIFEYKQKYNIFQEICEGLTMIRSFYSPKGNHSYGTTLYVNLTPIPQTTNFHHLNRVF
jgi:hypothetical protein